MVRQLLDDFWPCAAAIQQLRSVRELQGSSSSTQSTVDEVMNAQTGETKLHKAAKEGNTEEVESLLVRNSTEHSYSGEVRRRDTRNASQTIYSLYDDPGPPYRRACLALTASRTRCCTRLKSSMDGPISEPFAGPGCQT